MPSSEAPETESTAETAAEGAEVEAAPRDELRELALGELREHLGDAVIDTYIRPGQAAWARVHRDAWREAAVALKEKMNFEFFDFLSAIDWLPSPFGRDMNAQEDLLVEPEEPSEPSPMEHGYTGGETRFQLLASVLDTRRAFSVLLKADLPDDDLRAESWSDVYPGADWHERETWEMFGIDFTGHPGLSHIYLPSDFEGNPLRKDFPLLARRVKPWPGIVDVEPMPDSGDDGAGDEAAGDEASEEAS